MLEQILDTKVHVSVRSVKMNGGKCCQVCLTKETTRDLSRTLRYL